MIVDEQLVRDTAYAYYHLSSLEGPPRKHRKTDTSFRAAAAMSDSSKHTFFARFVNQCANFDVHPFWVLKVLFAFPANAHHKTLYPANLCSDYAWKVFQRNYAKLSEMHKYHKDPTMSRKRITKDQHILAVVRQSIYQLSSLLQSCSRTGMTPEEVLHNMYPVFSEYHLAAIPYIRSLVKSKSISAGYRKKIRTAYREMREAGVLEMAQELACGKGGNNATC